MIRLAKPAILENDIESVRSILLSGRLVQGETVERFEQQIAEYLGVKHCIAVSSGTAALHIALMALEIQRGDEVIVPDFTFPATANVVEILGAKAVLCDVSLDDCCLESASIESMINTQTRAIIPVHEFGHSADIDKIMELAKRYDLKVVEDAACAFGTKHRGSSVGTFGDIGCFSFHPRKALTTGEGGICITGDDSLAEKLRLLRNHGMKRSDSGIDFVLPGLNYRMTEFQAALGIAQLARYDSDLQCRSRIAERYFEGFKDNTRIQLPVIKPYSNHCFQTFHILLDESLDRDTLINELKEDGIETNYGANCLSSTTYYRTMKRSHNGPKVNASILAQRGLAIPLYPGLESHEIDRVIECLNMRTK